MTTKPRWRAIYHLAFLCVISQLGCADNNREISVPEPGVTFSHVYKIDLPESSSCKLEAPQSQENTGSFITNIFRHSQ